VAFYEWTNRALLEYPEIQPESTELIVRDVVSRTASAIRCRLERHTQPDDCKASFVRDESGDSPDNIVAIIGVLTDGQVGKLRNLP